MTRRSWQRLDNASNIFLAARTEADPKVFRISAELRRPVDPEVLQQALDRTYDRYGLYHAVLRRGLFWYYLQDSDLRPRVSPETRHSCAPIYRPDRRELLFRVLHHRRRVVLEVFHALSDGTGALWFLSDLVGCYLELLDPDPTSRDGDGRPSPARPPERLVEPVHALATDSFRAYFHRPRRRGAPAPQPDQVEPDVAPPRTRLLATLTARAHRIPGTRNPDHRTRAVELTVSTQEMLTLARAAGVSLTIYLTALFFESVRRASPDRSRLRTLAASVPVNLRQFFPSASPRNFFATVRLEDSADGGADALGETCSRLEEQFRPQVSPEALERRQQRLARFERTAVLRVLPRPLKDVVLRVVNWFSNRGLTVAVSNLGRADLRGRAESEVGRMAFHVSAARPQLSAISHAGLLTLTFTSPFSETDHVREFARLLTGCGIEVTVAAARVTEAELAASGSGGPAR